MYSRIEGEKMEQINALDNPLWTQITLTKQLCAFM